MLKVNGEVTKVIWKVELKFTDFVLCRRRSNVRVKNKENPCSYWEKLNQKPTESATGFIFYG